MEFSSPKIKKVSYISLKNSNKYLIFLSNFYVVSNKSKTSFISIATY